MNNENGWNFSFRFEKKKHVHTHKCDRRKTRNLFFFKPFSLVPSDGRVFFIFLLRFFIFAPNPSTVTAMATGESFERETREISGGGQRRNRTRNAPISASIMAEPIFDVSFFFYLIRSVSRPRFPREPRTCYVFFYFIHWLLNSSILFLFFFLKSNQSPRFGIQGTRRLEYGNVFIC